MLMNGAFVLKYGKCIAASTHEQQGNEAS